MANFDAAYHGISHGSCLLDLTMVTFYTGSTDKTHMIFLSGGAHLYEEMITLLNVCHQRPFMTRLTKFGMSDPQNYLPGIPSEGRPRKNASWLQLFITLGENASERMVVVSQYLAIYYL